MFCSTALSHIPFPEPQPQQQELGAEQFFLRPDTQQGAAKDRIFHPFPNQLHPSDPILRQTFIQQISLIQSALRPFRCDADGNRFICTSIQPPAVFCQRIHIREPSSALRTLAERAYRDALFQALPKRLPTIGTALFKLSKERPGHGLLQNGKRLVLFFAHPLTPFQHGDQKILFFQAGKKNRHALQLPFRQIGIVTKLARISSHGR